MNLNQPIGVAPLMDMPIRWLAMGDAPAVVDASVSCKNPRDYNAMLRERQDRAGICVWLYQGEILFSSANIRHAAISAPIAADPNTGVGAPGDVVVMRNPPHVTCSSIGSSSEIEDLWSEGDRVWNSYPVSLGILALSARMLPDAFGTDCRIDGVANVGSFTRPYLAVADPTLFCYRDELNLAHEIGHVMSLGHRFDNPTFLMHWQSTGNNLSADEVRQARLWAALYLYGWPFWGAENLLASDATPANALPETRLRRNRVAAVLDSTGDVSDELGSLDWSKVVVVGREGADGGLGSFGALRDTISDTPTTYYFGIDTDANARTGASTKTLDPRWRMRGAELVVRLRVERGRERDSVRVYPTLYKAVRSGFV